MFDVIIIGAGIVGAAIARDLSRDGRSVLVIERSAAASGSSGRGEGNILVSDKAPGPELDLAIDARRRWPTVARELRGEADALGVDIEFEAKGGLVVATTDIGAQPLLDFAAGQRAVGVRAEAVDSATAHELEPHLSDGITAAVWYPDDAQVQPAIATEALLASARRAGGTVRSGVEVLAALLDDSGAIVGVETSAGEFRAPVVINAAGPWSGAVSTALGAPIPVRPRRGMVLVTTRMPHRVFHKVYDADYVGAVGSSSADLQVSSVVESTASGTVLIGSSREQVGFRDEFRAEIVSQLARRAMLLFPFLGSAAVLRSYSGFRPYMPDHLPVIGPDGRRPGLWHATGHEGAGIGLSIATSALIADLLAGRTPSVDPTAFALDRAGLREHLVAA
ncbi:MAG: FAD-dependent oxidoreductase [Leifsonia flava]